MSLFKGWPHIKGLPIILLGIMAAADIVILLDVPFFRPLMGFIFLTFVPGVLLVYILRLHRIDLVSRIVLSAGLSIAFLIFYGLLINSLLRAFGYAEPLATVPLLIAFNAAALVLLIIACLMNRDMSMLLPRLSLTAKEKAYIAVPVFFPLMGILGVHYMNLTDNNAVLLVLLFLIPAYVIFIALRKRDVPESVYPIALFLIGVSLLLMYALRSNHLIGSDIHQEFSFFQFTWQSLYLSQLMTDLISACLSVSILPVVYQSFLNIQPEYLFKILNPLLLSALPLVVFVLARKYVGASYAFLTAVFFMANMNFLNAMTQGRTNIAVLFWALAIMVMFHDNLGRFGRRVLFIVFTAGIIVSHYSTAYITFFVLFLTWFGMMVLWRIISRKSKITMSNRGIALMTVALFLCMLYLWYAQITGAPFTTAVYFIRSVIVNLTQFFILESRGGEAASILGADIVSRGVPWMIELALSWLTIAFIAFGVLFTIFRSWKSYKVAGNSVNSQSSFWQSPRDYEHLMLSLMCGAILVFAVVTPLVLKGYSTTRLYFQMMVVLSPFFIIACRYIAGFVKVKPLWLVLPIITLYFMTTSGTMYEMFDNPRVVTLNAEGKLYDLYYVSDRESYAAEWLGEFSENEPKIFLQSPSSKSHKVVTSHGRFPKTVKKELLPFYEEGKKIEGYIYLSEQDIADSGLSGEYAEMLASHNRIYVNGGSEIYRSLDDLSPKNWSR